MAKIAVRPVASFDQHGAGVLHWRPGSGNVQAAGTMTTFALYAIRKLECGTPPAGTIVGAGTVALETHAGFGWPARDPAQRRNILGSRCAQQVEGE